MFYWFDSTEIIGLLGLKGTTEDEIAGWHHGLDERESEWTPGDGDEQGGLACCDSWGRRKSDTTERLNWTGWFTRRLKGETKGLSHVDMMLTSIWVFLSILLRSKKVNSICSYTIFPYLSCITNPSHAHWDSFIPKETIDLQWIHLFCKLGGKIAWSF